MKSGDEIRKQQATDYRRGTGEALAISQRETRPYEVEVAGEKIIVHSGVFSPKYFDDTNYLAKHLPHFTNEDVLEIGSGTGALTIHIVKRGAQRVLALDLTEEAVRNTQENVLRHKLEDKIEVRKSDVYSAVLPHEKFHTIIWNVPWGYVEEDVSELERSVHDPFYASIAECILKAREYLLSKGRILLGFSTSLGKFDKLQKLAQEGGLVSTILAQRPASDDNPVSVEWVELR